MALTKISRSLLDTGVSDSSDATAITIDSSENVGIACTPHFPFDVQLNSSRRIGFNYSDSQNSILSHDGSGNIETLGLRGNTILFYSDYDASNPDGVERMRIDSSGNVGIGTTSPSFDLDIQDTSNTYLNVQATATSGEASLALKGKNSSGTDRTLLFKYDNSDLFRIATPSAVDIRFETSDAERMRINSSGNLLVGTTSPVSSTNTILKSGGVALVVQRTTDPSGGNSLFLGYGVGGAAVVSIRGDGDLENTNNNYGALSDERLKSNIVDANPQLEDIKKVKVRKYTLDSTGETHIGVIAQELEEAGMGGLVAEREETGYKGVKYSILYMKAIKAIQEQQEQIEALQSEINTLKGG